MGEGGRKEGKRRGRKGKEDDEVRERGRLAPCVRSSPPTPAVFSAFACGKWRHVARSPEDAGGDENAASVRGAYAGGGDDSGLFSTALQTCNEVKCIRV